MDSLVPVRGEYRRGDEKVNNQCMLLWVDGTATTKFQS